MIGIMEKILDINGVEIKEGDNCLFAINGLGSGNAKCFKENDGFLYLDVEGQEIPFFLSIYLNNKDLFVIEVIS